MMIESQRSEARLDRLAIIFSVVCLFHCLALPLIYAAIPLIGYAVLPHGMFHWYLLILVLPLSVVALVRGYRQHGSRLAAGLGVAGLAVLIVVAAIGHDLFGENLEPLFTSIGSVLVAAAHFVNQRLLSWKRATAA